MRNSGKFGCPAFPTRNIGILLPSLSGKRTNTGTILRKDWWSVFPKIREEFLSGLSQEDADLFAKYMEEAHKQNTIAPPLKEMSANDFFRACAIGYAANHYSSGDRTPREQYDLHADGRDGGLGEIDPDSPTAFLSWFTGQSPGKLSEAAIPPISAYTSSTKRTVSRFCWMGHQSAGRLKPSNSTWLCGKPVSQSISGTVPFWPTDSPEMRKSVLFPRNSACLL